MIRALWLLHTALVTAIMQYVGKCSGDRKLGNLIHIAVVMIQKNVNFIEFCTSWVWL